MERAWKYFADPFKNLSFLFYKTLPVFKGQHETEQVWIRWQMQILVII